MAAGEREKALDEFLQMVRKTSQQPAIVVDEANLALPGLTNGQDSRERLEAKSALAAITKSTKQDILSSVVLISSEFGYPFRLQAAGLGLRGIGKVIVLGEVPESDMLKMLKDDWGMDEDLAEMFYNYFGGDIFTTKQALESLIRMPSTPLQLLYVLGCLPVWKMQRRGLTSRTSPNKASLWWRMWRWTKVLKWLRRRTWAGSSTRMPSPSDCPPSSLAQTKNGLSSHRLTTWSCWLPVSSRTFLCQQDGVLPNWLFCFFVVLFAYTVPKRTWIEVE